MPSDNSVQDGFVARVGERGRGVSTRNSDRQEPESAFVPNSAQAFCLFILCVGLLSAFANEFSDRLFHNTAYISAVTAVLLPLAVLLSRNAWNGAKITLGRWWIAFGAWLLVCIPFSVWKTGTIQLLSAYYFRTYLLYFAICACAVGQRQLTKLMYTLIASTGLTVIMCFAFGSVGGDDRFAVLGSQFSFLSNANELALTLLFGIIILTYLLFQKRGVAQLVSLVLIPVAFVYMLRTGSRGVFVALIAVVLTVLVISHSKVKVLALICSVVVLGVLAVPSASRHRLMYIGFGDEEVSASNQVKGAAQASQAQRESLLTDSLKMTLQHPFFGVGPGQFAVARWDQITATGQWAAWLGTHNSYTEVSSEAGIPGFIFYLGSIIVCLRMNYRTYKETISVQGMSNYAGLSFCMLLSTVLYAVSTFFFHIAYTSFLPVIAGITAATRLALDQKAPV